MIESKCGVSNRGRFDRTKGKRRRNQRFRVPSRRRTDSTNDRDPDSGRDMPRHYPLDLASRVRAAPLFLRRPPASRPSDFRVNDFRVNDFPVSDFCMRDFCMSGFGMNGCSASLSAWWLVGLLLAALVAPGCSSGGDAPSGSAAPDTSALNWTHPVEASAPLPHRAKWPSLAVDSSGTVRLSATTTPDTSHTPDEVVLLRQQADASWKLEAEVSKTPTVSRRSTALHVGDTTHVLWVEHDPPTPDVPTGTSVWHRACTPGGCTVAASLYRIAPDRAAEGRVMPPSPLHAGARGVLTTATEVFDRKRSGVYLYERPDSAWIMRKRFLNAATPVLIAADTRHHLVYIADLNRGETPDPNSVVSRSNTCQIPQASGREASSPPEVWCPPRLIHASNGQKAQAPSAAIHGSQLHVAWLTSVASSPPAQCVMHRSASTTDSTSASPVTRFCPPAPGRMYDVETVVDGRGRLHLIATWQPYFAAPRGHLYHAVHHNGVWSPLRRIPGIEHSAIQVDAQYASDRLHVAWTHIRDADVQVRYTSAEP